jgi:hypothetical protein
MQHRPCHRHLWRPSAHVGGVLLIALVAAAIGTAPARAAFPGTNGKLVFETNRDGNEEIYTMNADGGDASRVTHDANDDRRPTWTADGHILFQNGASPTARSSGSTPTAWANVSDVWEPDPGGCGWRAPITDKSCGCRTLAQSTSFPRDHARQWRPKGRGQGRSLKGG